MFRWRVRHYRSRSPFTVRIAVANRNTEPNPEQELNWEHEPRTQNLERRTQMVR